MEHEYGMVLKWDQWYCSWTNSNFHEFLPVNGSEIRRSPAEMVKISHDLLSLNTHPRWCRISSINSTQLAPSKTCVSARTTATSRQSGLRFGWVVKRWMKNTSQTSIVQRCWGSQSKEPLICIYLINLNYIYIYLLKRHFYVIFLEELLGLLTETSWRVMQCCHAATACWHKNVGQKICG